MITVVASCAEEKAVKVPNTVFLENADEYGLAEISFFNKAESKSLTFTADGDWSIRVPKEDAAWVSVNPSSGSASGESVTVEVSVSANEDAEDRSTLLAFVCDKLEQKALACVKQVRAYNINAEVDKTLINKNGGNFTFNVSTNGTWEYEINEAGKNWLSEASKEGNTLVLTAGPLLTDLNEAAVKFYVTEEPEVSETIDVVQNSIDIVIKAAKVQICGDGATVPVDIEKINVNDWNIAVDGAPKWISATKNGASAFTITAQKNTGAERSAKIVITSPEEPMINSTLEVVQCGVFDTVFDASFSEDGSAKDLTGKHAITAIDGTKHEMKQDETTGQWYPVFNHTLGSTVNPAASGWCFDIDDALKTNLSDGFTMEAIASIGATPNSKECKIFSSTKSGGLALMISKDNRLTFLINNGGTWAFCYGITPVVGQVYHLLGVWNKEEAKMYFYIDGELVNTLENITSLKYGSLNPNYFTIGANQSSAAYAVFNGAWNGAVKAARIYDSPLTEVQVRFLGGEKFIVTPVE
jgi:hypothetical protein